MAKLFYLAGMALVSLSVPSSLMAECGPSGCSYESAVYCDCGGGTFSATGMYYGGGSPELLTEAPSDRALLILGLPDEKAEVYIQGVLTGTIGKKRQYLTPPLEANKIYVYEIKVIHTLAVEPADEVLFEKELLAETKLKVPVLAGTVTKARASVDETSKLTLLISPTEAELKLKIKPPVPPVPAPDPAAPETPDDSAKD